MFLEMFGNIQSAHVFISALKGCGVTVQPRTTSKQNKPGINQYGSTEARGRDPQLVEKCSPSEVKRPNSSAAVTNHGDKFVCEERRGHENIAA